LKSVVKGSEVKII